MPSRPRTRRWQEVDKSDIRLDSAIQSYLMYHEDRNHSPKSVRWYADMLRRFAASLGPDARLGEIDADGIRKYMRSVRERDFSKFTLHGYARSLKTFLRWLEREGYLGEQLSRHVDLPKVPKYEDVTIDVLTDEEIAHLLSVLDPATDVGCRDRAIVCLMLESGLRLDEVAGLQVDDVHFKDMYVKVHGKGDKEGYVRIFVDEGEPMRNLLRHAAAGGIASSYTRRLLSGFDKPALPASTPAQAGAADLAEPLTMREVEILLADTVRGLCSGKGFLFADRGEFVASAEAQPCTCRFRRPARGPAPSGDRHAG